MARKIRTSYRLMRKKHPELHRALTETAGMTSNRALNYLQRRKLNPLLTEPQLKNLVAKAQRGSGIPIIISKNMTKGYRGYEGIAMGHGKNVSVRIHPIVRYQGQRYAQDMIDHELDHAKVMKRAIEKGRRY